jgi:hypothetical protein
MKSRKSGSSFIGALNANMATTTSTQMHHVPCVGTKANSLDLSVSEFKITFPTG